MNECENFKTQLPGIEEFYSNLNMRDIADADQCL